VVSPYARCDPARTGRPSCRDGHTILEGGVRATSGGDLRGRVSTAAEMSPPRVFLVVEDLGCRDRPEDFLLDDRCAEVLDFVSPKPSPAGTDEFDRHHNTAYERQHRLILGQ
jgi:hypothetical protein